jgi:hypothetical protein
LATRPAAGAEDCKKALDFAKKIVDGQPAGNRVYSVLEELAKACPAMLGSLASVAKNASELRRPERSALLAKAGYIELKGDCTAPEPLKPARALEKKCPLVSALKLGKDTLEHADQGSYLFAVAVQRRLASNQAFVPAAKSLLETMLDTAAVEAKEAAKHPAP